MAHNRPTTAPPITAGKKEKKNVNQQLKRKSNTSALKCAKNSVFYKNIVENHVLIQNDKFEIPN